VGAVRSFIRFQESTTGSRGAPAPAPSGSSETRLESGPGSSDVSAPGVPQARGDEGPVTSRVVSATEPPSTLPVEVAGLTLGTGCRVDESHSHLCLTDGSGGRIGQQIVVPRSSRTPTGDGDRTGRDDADLRSPDSPARGRSRHWRPPGSPGTEYRSASGRRHRLFYGDRTGQRDDAALRSPDSPTRGRSRYRRPSGSPGTEYRSTSVRRHQLFYGDRTGQRDDVAPRSPDSPPRGRARDR
jgi:hypothetical protein